MAIAPTPYQAVTPRSRQEMEPQALLRTRRLIPVTPLPSSADPLLVPIDKRMFAVERMWAANVSGSEASYSLHIITDNGASNIGNAIAYNVAVPANTTLEIIGLSGMLLAPGQSLVAVASSADAINVFGIGWDIIGESQ